MLRVCRRQHLNRRRGRTTRSSPRQRESFCSELVSSATRLSRFLRCGLCESLFLQRTSHFYAIGTPGSPTWLRQVFSKVLTCLTNTCHILFAKGLMYGAKPIWRSFWRAFARSVSTPWCTLRRREEGLSKSRGTARSSRWQVSP